jgi:hypothetical protein
MRRTTISRSRGGHTAAVALALGLIAAPLGAQAQQPQQAAPQATGAARTAQPVGPPPPTHIVQQGETLWSLAQQFMGDPLLWPEIYRLNPTVIEDPHWIFPGEELRLVPGSETAAAPTESGAPASAAPAPAAAGGITVAPTAGDSGPSRAPTIQSGSPFNAPTIFASRSAITPSAATMQFRNQQAYRAVRAGEHFSAGFLTEGEQLRSGRLLGNTRTASVSRLTTTTSATLFSDVAVAPPPGDTLKPGDLLLSYETPRIIDHYGQVVRPTGLLRVTTVGGADQNVSALVVGVFQTISSDQRVVPVAPFRSSTANSVATDSGIVGSVIDIRDPHELATQQDVLFIDRGSEDGVREGDIFQISGVSPVASGIGAVVQNEAKVLIVYTRPHTCTGTIIELERPDIRPGAAARQIRRMPS